MEWELVNAGYEQLPVKEQFRRRQSDFCKNNIEITLSYLTYNGGGSLILNGLPQWVWRADSLLLNDYLLDGVYAKVIHPKQLLEEKKTYQRIGRPYRKKDAESKKVLKEIISKFS
nr:hypothetical protein [Alkalicoccobacillus gibsonii]